MTADGVVTIIMLVLAALTALYLVVALLFPERF